MGCALGDMHILRVRPKCFGCRNDIGRYEGSHFWSWCCFYPVLQFYDGKIYIYIYTTSKKTMTDFIYLESECVLCGTIPTCLSKYVGLILYPMESRKLDVRIVLPMSYIILS